jgi:hypothetical protein
MEKRIIEKYVKDLDGMLKEIKRWEEEAPLWETVAENLMYESAVVFAFGRLFKFFNFSGIHFGLPMRLDATVEWKNEWKDVEFEVFSKDFIEHIKKGQVKPEDYKETIIICWEHNWRECPKEIDIIELRHFWQLAKSK